MEPHDRISELLLTLRQVVDMAGRTSTQTGQAFAELMSTHLGCDASSLSVLSEDVVGHRFADWDVALEHLAAQDPRARAVGVGGGQQHHQSLGELVSTEFGRPRVGQVEYIQVPTGPDTQRQAIGFGARMFRFRDQPVVVMQRKAEPMYGVDIPRFEVLCPDPRVAADVLVETSRLGTQLSLLRGQVISFTASSYDHNAAAYSFLPRPQLPGDEVILPDGVLEQITNHVLGVADHTDVLRRFGQHLKRGILLYGPPGTGKTHTVRHLVGQSPQHTVVLLRGATLAYISQAAVIARALQPAMVVLEDCDLVATDRDYSPTGAPLLFEVLDALDGLDMDSDVSFLLTTNRVDLLEEALVERPGRVDLAVEIPLPDRRNRRRLLGLYRRDVPFSDEALELAADQTEGTTAAFAKELIRRAVLEAAVSDESPSDTHLDKALTLLLSERESLTRRLLGVGDDTDTTVGGDQGSPVTVDSEP